MATAEVMREGRALCAHAGAAVAFWTWRRQALALGVLVVLGLALRYAFVAENFVVSPDSVEYLRAAQAIERDGLSAVRSSVRQPLYPMVLWAAGALAERAVPDFGWTGAQMAEVGRWAGIVLYVPFLIAVWLFSRRLAGKGLGLWCVAAVIVYPLFGFYFANVLSETLYLACFILALLCLVNACDEAGVGTRRWAWALAAGAAAAVSFLVRVEGQVLVAAGLAYLAGRTLARRSAMWPAVKQALSRAGMLGAGYAAVALPLVFYTGASAQRYSWEWLWHKLTAAPSLSSSGICGGAVFAAIGLAAAPHAALWMFVKTIATRGAEVLIPVIGAFSYHAIQRARGGKGVLPQGYGVVLVTFGVYVAAIVAGASIQNGAVSYRYVEPIIIMLLPVGVLFSALVMDVLPYGRWFVKIVSVPVFVGAFYGAAWDWENYKTGFRDAGLAIAARGSGSAARVLTTNSRILFYSDASGGVIDPRRMASEIRAARTGGYDFVALEVKDYAPDDFLAMGAALEKGGFGTALAFRFKEDGVPEHSARTVIVYRRGAA